MAGVNPLSIFAVALSISTLLSALQDLREGRWHGPSVGTRLTRGSVVTRDSRAAIQGANRGAIAARISGPILLLAGIFPRTAAALILFALIFTLLLQLKHNTLFMATGMAILASAKKIPTLQTPNIAEPDPWSLASIAVLLVGLYVGGALAKLQSDQFRSGATILIILSTILPSTIEVLQRVPRTAWRAVGLSVIVLEITIIALLLIPAGLLTALIVGGIVHCGFALIHPGRLIPFQIATLGSYPAAAAGLTMLW